MIPIVDLDKHIESIEKPWTPVDISEVNDYVLRLAMFHGEYHWHKHEDEDELFYVYRGSVTIQVKDKEDVLLKQGQMTTIPAGVEHCPKSSEPSYVVMFEPKKLNSKGD